jgi:hypothetical protein
MRMNDAISRSAVLAVGNVRKVTEYDEAGYDMTYDAVPVEAIKALPGLDVVPVVRCYECKYRCTQTCPMYHTEICLDDLDGFDSYDTDRTDEDGFCHLGARMDGEAE